MIRESRFVQQTGTTIGTIVLGLAMVACGGSTKTDSSSNPHGPDEALAGDASPSSGDAHSEGALTDGGSCVDCFILYDLHWGMNGGLAASVETSRLGPCRSYTHERTNAGGGLPTTMCTVDVSGCPARTIADIDTLIGDPDVTRSLQNHVVYGNDPRPVDGQLFRFGVGNDYVDIGLPCGAGVSSCVDIPAAIAQMNVLLQGLDHTELASEPCKSTFGR